MSDLHVGFVLPNEWSSDPGWVVDFARCVDEGGYHYLLAFDHVLGAEVTTRPAWKGAYTLVDPFHEPLILFSHLAALTHLHFFSGVLVLPQRQTALVAKQATELQLLSNGRFRLGVGLGWNEVEYQAMGYSFAKRARRFEEQIGLLRLLWTQESVDFSGEFDRIDRAGLSPRPRRPIPIWIGTFGTSGAALRRIGRLADGWNPLLPPGPDLTRAKAVVHKSAEEAGRDPDAIGLEGRIRVPAQISEDEIRRQLEAWADLGADYVAFDTLHVGLCAAEHEERVAQLARIRDSVLG